MALLDIRQRVGWLFTTVTVLHLILISAQVQTRRGVPMLEEAIFGTMAEVQRVATGGIGEARGFWQNYVNLRQIGRENETLKQRVSQLEVALQRERATAQQTRVLQQALDLKTETPFATTAAMVIASGASTAMSVASPCELPLSSVMVRKSGLAPTRAARRGWPPTWPCWRRKASSAA
jgi:cell shape-determining protein MreC